MDYVKLLCALVVVTSPVSAGKLLDLYSMQPDVLA